MVAELRGHGLFGGLALLPEGVGFFDDELKVYGEAEEARFGGDAFFDGLPEFVVIVDGLVAGYVFRESQGGRLGITHTS